MSSPKSTQLYSVVLHVLLIGLACSVVLLARQNQQLQAQIAPATQAPTLAAGDDFEPFLAHHLDGSETVLASAEESDSERLLFFFTTTCPSCQENQDRWRALYERVGHRIDVVGVSLDNPERTRQYREQMDLPFPVVTLPEPQVFAREREIFLVPFTVHLKGEGEVRETWLGVLSDDDIARI